MKRIVNHEHLIRDDVSKAIINKDSSKFLAAKSAKKQRKDTIDRLNTLEDKIEKILSLLEKTSKK